jgi:hypothetical protein
MGENYMKQFFVNTLVEEPHTKWRCDTLALVNNSSRAAGHDLRRSMTSIKVYS